MNAWFLRVASTLCAAALCAGVAHAKPKKVEAFDVHTWAQLQGSLGAPAVVVFTTTDCIYCPATIRDLATEIRQWKLQAQLITVVMDAAPGDMDAELLRNPHYQPSDRLLAFEGQAPALRYTVNPGWRGVTPYVAFLRPGVSPAWVTGHPTERDLQAWLRLTADDGNGR